MLVYIDMESGSWGLGESNLVFTELDDQEVDHLEALTDLDRMKFACEIARRDTTNPLPSPEGSRTKEQDDTR